MMPRKPRSTYVMGIVLVSVLSGMHPTCVLGGGGSFGGGSGTAADPYIIEDALDLQNMSGDLDAHYALIGDIDASATRTWNAGAGFMPVGRKNTPFTGSLDGRNHTITSLFIKRSAIEYVGLFGSIGASGSVKDVGLVQGDVTGNNYAGALAGANLGTVVGVHSTGRVSSTGYCVGGLVGYNDGGTVDDSHVTGRVTAGSTAGGLVGSSNLGAVNNSYATGDVTSPGDCVGGLIGFNTAPVSYSHATGNVTGKELVGGLVGDNRNTISDCYATGKVSGSRCVGGLEGGSFGNISSSHATGAVVGGDYVGGLAGVADATVSSSYATGNVTGTDDWIAGLVGQNQGTVKYSYSIGNVTGLGGVSGLVGWYSGSTVIESYYNIDKVHINGGHHVTYRGLFDAQYKDWSSGGKRLRISDYGTTLVPSGDHYEIGSIQGLRDLLGFADVAGRDFHLSSDIDLSSAPGLYIPYLGGVFDGSNHTISNLSLDLTFANYLGMFGVVAGGTVKDVMLTDGRVSGCDYVGGLAGMGYGLLSNLNSVGDVSGRHFVGGLMGYGNGGPLRDAYAAGNVTASNYTGGLAGYLTGEVSDSHAAENVTGSNNVGGLIGFNWAKLRDCHSNGLVTGTQYVGGLMGYNWGAVTRSYSTATVRGTIYSRYVGGLVGVNYLTTTSSYATGDVSGQDEVGGLVGCIAYTGKVNNSYATGNVDAPYNAGGLVGVVSSSATVDNSYSIGRVTGRVGTGGLVGANSGTVANSFWDTETSGMSTSAGGTGRTTAEMRTRSTFTDAGWDFASVWFIVEDVTYPLLRWQDEQPPQADAGSDQAVDEDATVTFDGSGSSDDLLIVDSTWTLLDGAVVTLHGLAPSYAFSDPGTYVVTLNVTDAAGSWDTDDMTVTVSDVTAPNADAGPDQTVDEGALVAFDGSGSSDNAGITNYTWTFTDGVPVSLFGVGPAYRFDRPGTFNVTLSVADAAGHWDTDTMTVAVSDITPPVADAGPDQTVDEGALVTFDGRLSTDNVGAVSWTWTLVDGAPISLLGVGPQHRFISPGTFLVTLSVADAAGNVGTDSMTVVVRDVTPPVADAGPDQVVDILSFVTLDGGRSTDNVGVVDHTWTFVDGAVQTLSGVSPTYQFRNWGVFVVTLEVEDAAGHTGTDTMTVTVWDSIPPSAEAGPDQTVDVGATVTFDGSGSSDNLGVVNYTWSIQRGAGMAVLYGVSPSHVFVEAGAYSVVLRVYDAAGLWAEDSMAVTVVDVTPPEADAGPDQMVPVGSTVVFNGSLSSDDGGIAGFTWSFSSGGQTRTLAGMVAQFAFTEGGAYEVTLRVRDAAGNEGSDAVVIAVVDTGWVTGTVLDDGGSPVREALVRVTASNGRTYAVSTAANGSFTLEVFHGTFEWSVMKQGYRAISGSSSVLAMGTRELDLSGTPMERVDEGSPATSLMMAVLLVAILAALGLLVLERRRRGGSKEVA